MRPMLKTLIETFAINHIQMPFHEQCNSRQNTHPLSCPNLPQKWGPFLFGLEDFPFSPFTIKTLSLITSSYSLDVKLRQP
jgi:hypothetical protein